MTMHSSLKTGGAKKGHRSVLKRFERLTTLMEKDKWDESKSVFGLPKVKTLKMKIKKEKAAVAEVEGAEAVAGAAAAPAAAPGKAAAPAAAAGKAATPAAKKEDKKK